MPPRPLCSFEDGKLDEHPAYRRLLELPLGQPIHAERELIELLDSILEGSPEAGPLFSILEELRGPFCFVREAAVRHYLAKAPHLDAEDEAGFQRGIDATRMMMRCYTCCANQELNEMGSRTGDAAWTQRLATILHRSLHYSAMFIFEHYRAKRELPPGTWARHNALFSTASRLGAATLPIEDHIFDQTRLTHCQTAFSTPLLVELSRPYGRNARDLNLIWQWAEQAAHHVGIEPLAAPKAVSAYGIDLEQDRPLRPLDELRGGHACCRVDTGALTGHLRLTIEKLARGIAPERLGLCPETVEQSTRLLGKLASFWSLEAGKRRQARTHLVGRVQVCAGFPDIHHFVLGGEPRAACIAQLKRLDRADNPHRLESWQIVDRSPDGIGLSCDTSASMLANGQLLALRPDETSPFLFGQVEWLRREQSGRLLAGIAILPGRPQAVCLRAAPRIKGQKGSFVRAFLLHDTSGTRPAVSLIAPADTTRQDQTVEILHDRQWEIRLGGLLRQGVDFMQAEFREA